LVLWNLVALLPALLMTQVGGTVVYGVIGFLLTALLGAVINFMLLGPFASLVSTARKVFHNPLMSKIYTGRDDEFGEVQLALKMQHSQLNAVVGRMSDTTRIIGSVAEITARTSNEANQGVFDQKGEIMHVATAMTEMTATVQEIARNASVAAESTKSGMEETASGKQVVDETISSINALAQEVQRSADVIQTLSENSSNIGDILGVIKGIAEQTNLLALNAAIEAARAGEQGRGFAVVADEVRTLAGRTQESTLEIEEMIERLQGGSRDAVQVMEHSREQAEHSVELAAKAGDALMTITGSINTITDMNHQIATASEEQSAVAEEINQNIVNISDVADRTSQGAQQSVDAIEEMVQAIQRMNALVTQFARSRNG
jgi:methyl-accepting chemotaxis protein